MSSTDPTAEFLAAGTKYFQKMSVNEAELAAGLNKKIGDLTAAMKANADSSDKLAKVITRLTAVGLIVSSLGVIVAWLSWLTPRH